MESGLPPIEFAKRYDEAIFRRPIRALYGATGYFNVGDWSGGTQDLSQACAALVRRHVDAAETCGVGAPAVVLDVACGLGDSTHLMAGRWPAALVVGVNISPTQLAHARHRHPGAAWAAMDAVHLAVADGSVDLIVSVEAVPHFSSRAAFLAAAWRALRPGGALVLSDALFVDPGAASSLWIAGSDTADREGYGALCRSQGFEITLLEDVTEVTWRGFCRFLRSTPHWRRIADRIDPAIGCYLMVALSKPFGGVGGPLTR